MVVIEMENFKEFMDIFLLKRAFRPL